jgi:hypothetical protein
MNKIKWLILIVVLFFLIKIPWVIYFLVDGKSLLDNREKDDALFRRAYVIEKVTASNFGKVSMFSLLSDDMQLEWSFGTMSMATAALANIAFDFPETRKQSVKVIRTMISRALTPEFRSFDTHLSGEDPLKSLAGNEGHIGYLGHLSFMLGAYRIIGGDYRYDTLYKKITDALTRRLNQKAFPYLKTYEYMPIFTADNTVVMASLRLYDMIFHTNHDPIIRRWLDYTKEHLLDPETQLMVFYVGYKGNPMGGCRGSGIGWNSFYLPFIDTSFAMHQFKQMKVHLIKSLPLGAAALREYPKGKSGPADIDSGPIIFGMSTSGTGFAVAGARHSKDVSLLSGLMMTAETVGFSVQWKQKRKYLLAPLVGEAIMLAMKTARVWDNRYIATEINTATSIN